MFIRLSIVSLTATWTFLCACQITAAAEPIRLTFDTDPGWEGFRNRLVPELAWQTRQHFGWQATNHAQGESPGELGGWVARSVTPASYSKPIAVKTLQDRLTAAGRFAVTQDSAPSGVLFGWFHETSRGWRTPNSLALRLDGNGGKYWVFFEYGTRSWLTGGRGCFEGERYQTTKTAPFPADGTSHTWTLTYDPHASSDNGEVVLVLDGQSYELPLPKSHKEDGAEFNRFGLWNLQIHGGGMEVFFDDLVLDGEQLDLSTDEGWMGTGNQVEFTDRIVRPFHDFGYGVTRYAGGRQAGEIGGVVFRDENPAYYAAHTRPLSLDEPLSASGRMAFTRAGSDSGLLLGWFDSTSKQTNTPDPRAHVTPQRNMLAIMLEGPSQVGHLFRPAYRTRAGEGRIQQTGPLVRPDGHVHTWSLDYAPPTGPRPGRITVQLDDEVTALEVDPLHSAQGATFDRFGLFNIQAGGHHVEVYLDELTFSGQSD